MSTTGRMKRAATTFYKRLASFMSERKNIGYSKINNWIRCRLCFTLLRSSIMAIRGNISCTRQRTQQTTHEPIDLQTTKGKRKYSLELGELISCCPLHVNFLSFIALYVNYWLIFLPISQLQLDGFWYLWHRWTWNDVSKVILSHETRRQTDALICQTY